MWDGSRACSKRSVSAETTGSTNPSWSTTRIRAARARHPRELGDDELRAASVMEDAHAARDVERAVRERQRRRVADDQLAVRRRELVAGRDELGREVDPDDAARRTAPARRRARPAPQPLSSARSAPVEGREQLLDAVLQRRGALLLDRHAISDHVTHRRPHAPLGWPARRSRRRSRTGSCLKPARAPRSGRRRRSA